MPNRPQTLHLFLDYALPPLRQGVPPPPLPQLPALQAVLARMQAGPLLQLPEDAPDTPLQRVLAATLDLPGKPGSVPWAAQECGVTGTPCAWVRPSHWQLGMDSAVPVHPARLGLDDEESRALATALTDFMAGDGIALEYHRPDAWLARGEVFRHLRSCSLERAADHPLTREAVAVRDTDGGNAAAALRRMQSEWQMLLSQHPVNQARENTGQYTVNALWVEGAGALEQVMTPAVTVRLESALAVAGTDIAAHQAAWGTVGTGSVAELLRHLQGGGPARLTLCSHRAAITCTSRRGLLGRVASRFKPLRLDELRERL